MAKRSADHPRPPTTKGVHPPSRKKYRPLMLAEKVVAWSGASVLEPPPIRRSPTTAKSSVSKAPRNTRPIPGKTSAPGTATVSVSDSGKPFIEPTRHSAAVARE
ncbi:MAG TPA: hypothetical protein VN033_04580, partial [Vulgatibacter sp.]|nr:hypothetical protein [Vulgatibacter sp.]